MQPNNDNQPVSNNNVDSPQPINTNPPVVAPVPQPVAPQVVVPVAAPVQAPQPNVYNNNQYSNDNFILAYFKTLKTLFVDPKSYFDNPPINLVKSLIFPAISLAIMALMVIITSVIKVLTAPTIKTTLFGISTTTGPKLSGEFFGELFKNLGLSALYVVIFLAAISGIIMVVALISKKTVAFKDIFSMSSIFSLNFLAVSVSLVFSLIAGWVNNIDFSSIIYLLSNIVVSLVFVYACILIIQGINQVSGFNIFKSTAIYVVSIILMAFIFGKVIKTFPNDFSISFGSYSNSALNSGSYSSFTSSLEKAIEDFYF